MKQFVNIIVILTKQSFLQSTQPFENDDASYRKICNKPSLPFFPLVPCLRYVMYLRSVMYSRIRINVWNDIAVEGKIFHFNNGLYLSIQWWKKIVSKEIKIIIHIIYIFTLTFSIFLRITKNFRKKMQVKEA